MVKTTGIGYVVISIGTLLLGVPLAGLVALGVEHLWSGMGWLGFLATLSSWMAFGVSRLFREHGNTDIMPHRMAGRSKGDWLVIKRTRISRCCRLVGLCVELRRRG